MKRGSIIKALFREGFKIVDRFWRHIRPELDDHVSSAGADHRHFVVWCAHGNGGSYLIESAGTILMLWTSTRLVGLLGSPPRLMVTGVLAIFVSTSSPLISLPKAVYL